MKYTFEQKRQAAHAPWHERLSDFVRVIGVLFLICLFWPKNEGGFEE